MSAELTNMTEIAERRGMVYGFLAAIYRREITPEMLVQIKGLQANKNLSEMGVNIDDEFFARAEDELIEDLAIEYTRLFLGPGQHISPHESIHNERDDG
ncbi:molecular chaperone TorD family protein, partial [bacterium]|nr:molecular chaperone TorD family protein [bacterium]